MHIHTYTTLHTMQILLVPCIQTDGRNETSILFSPSQLASQLTLGKPPNKCSTTGNYPNIYIIMALRSASRAAGWFQGGCMHDYTIQQLAIYRDTYSYTASYVLQSIWAQEEKLGSQITVAAIEFLKLRQSCSQKGGRRTREKNQISSQKNTTKNCLEKVPLSYLLVCFVDI